MDLSVTWGPASCWGCGSWPLGAECRLVWASWAAGGGCGVGRFCFPLGLHSGTASPPLSRW